MSKRIIRRQMVLRVTLFVLLFSTVGMAKGLAQSTMGTDFWMTFLPTLDANPLTMSLIAAGPRECSGTVVNPTTNWSKSFNVSVGTTTVVTIPIEQAFNLGTNPLSNTALHIVSTDTISLYASNFQLHSFDVTDVLPTAALGSEYIIQTYSANFKGMGSPSVGKEGRAYDCSEFTIVATEDGTKVNIVLSANSVDGHSANQPFSVNLNKGQCYQVKSVSYADLSGSQVSVTNDKNVAVFAGNYCAHVPTGCEACDHIVEQMMPITCWGKCFVVTNSKMRSYDVVRVTALNDNCQIRRNGVLLSTINARQTYEFNIQSNTPSVYLETSEPAEVFLFIVGASCAGSNGDPSMVIISPIEQRISNVTFSTFNSGASQYHYVNIVTDSEKTSTMRLDGNSISSQFQVVSGNSEYSYARVQVSHGSHTLSNDKGGFVAHVYGLGDYESYAYSVGSMAKNLSSQLLVDNMMASDYPTGFDVCGTDPIVFNLDLNFDYSHVRWNFGDGQDGNTCPITHAYANSGDYEVSCDVYIEEQGVETLVSTLTTTIHAHSTYSIELFATHCDSYTWLGQNYIASGRYEHLFHSDFGCDSLLVLNLTIEQIETHVQDNGCDS